MEPPAAAGEFRRPSTSDGGWARRGRRTLELLAAAHRPGRRGHDRQRQARHHQRGTDSADVVRLGSTSCLALIIFQMMAHAWGGYAEYAWGANELRPVSLREHSGSVFGTAQMGATIVDGMDTLYLMGMMEEYNKGRDWIEQYLDFNHMVRRFHIESLHRALHLESKATRVPAQHL